MPARQFRTSQSIDRAVARRGAGDLAMTPVSPPGGSGGDHPLQADPARPPRPALGCPARSGEHGPQGAERGAEPDRSQRRASLLAARFRPAARRSEAPSTSTPCGSIFQDLFLGVWTGRLENDGFNRLVLAAGLSPRQIVTLRAYCRYMLQIGTPFSQAYVEQTLGANPGLARDLATLFDARFDPARGEHSEELQVAIEARILEQLNQVASLDQDRILRRYLELIKATCAPTPGSPTRPGKPKDYVSYKFDPRRIPALPAPRPAFEIFVYAPYVEGVHLRGGRVARGGLRWSDRREDFRTEVLGLMKAQMVKNAVIVPVGAKGGFVLKRPPAGGRPGRVAGRGRPLLQDLPARPARHHRRSGSVGRGPAARTSSATTATTPTSWSPPTRAPPPSPTTPTASAGSMASGSTTHSPRAVLPATTTRRWASPPRVPGSRSSGTSASWGWIPRPSRSRSSASATCRATCSATACCCRSRSGSWRRSTIGTSSWTPIPIRPRSFAERQRLFDLPRSSWDDYDKALISPGGGIWPRSAKIDADLSPRPGACSASKPRA